MTVLMNIRGTNSPQKVSNLFLCLVIFPSTDSGIVRNRVGQEHTSHQGPHRGNELDEPRLYACIIACAEARVNICRPANCVKKAKLAYCTIVREEDVGVCGRNGSI